MTDASLPASHHVTERFLPRSDILRGDLCAITRAHSAILWERSARPVMTDPASFGLCLGLHCGGLGQTRIDNHDAPSILSPKGVDRRKGSFGIERLHGAPGILRRFENDRAPSEDTRQAPFCDGRRRHNRSNEAGRQEASLEHHAPLLYPVPCKLLRYSGSHSNARDLREQLRNAFLECEGTMNPCHKHAEECHGNVQG